MLFHVDGLHRLITFVANVKHLIDAFKMKTKA